MTTQPIFRAACQRQANSRKLLTVTSMLATSAHEETARLAEKFRLLQASVRGLAEETATVRAALGSAATPVPDPFPHVPYAVTRNCPHCEAALVKVTRDAPALSLCPQCGYVGRWARRS